MILMAGSYRTTTTAESVKTTAINLAVASLTLEFSKTSSSRIILCPLFVLSLLFIIAYFFIKIQYLQG